LRETPALCGFDPDAVETLVYDDAFMNNEVRSEFRPDDPPEVVVWDELLVAAINEMVDRARKLGFTEVIFLNPGFADERLNENEQKSEILAPVTVDTLIYPRSGVTFGAT
jgi:hypothetical protein